MSGLSKWRSRHTGRCVIQLWANMSALNMESHSVFFLAAPWYSTALCTSEIFSSAPSFNCSALQPSTSKSHSVMAIILQWKWLLAGNSCMLFNSVKINKIYTYVRKVEFASHIINLNCFGSWMVTEQSCKFAPVHNISVLIPVCLFMVSMKGKKNLKIGHYECRKIF